MCPADNWVGVNLFGLDVNNVKRKAFNYLQNMRTKAVYGKISETNGVAGNVGTPLAADCVGAAVDWPATSVKEVRATRAERAERAIMATNWANNRKRKVEKVEVRYETRRRQRLRGKKNVCVGK